MTFGFQENDSDDDDEGGGLNSSRKKKPRRSKIVKRIEFHANDKVEVFSLEDGFQGSWHPGTVVSSERNGYQLKYVVKYDNLLVEDASEQLIDCLYVSEVVNDIICTTVKQSKNRGRIRPLEPCVQSGLWNLCYGYCVDVYYNEAWWEGVVFDHEDGSKERNIFFPELGDEMLVHIDAMRITRDWDDVTGTWQNRGTWLFLEMIEEYERENYIPVSIKQLWYDLRERDDFKKLGEWTSKEKDLWNRLVSEAIEDNMKVVVHHLLRDIGLPENGQKQLEIATSFYDANKCTASELAKNPKTMPVEISPSINMFDPNSLNNEFTQEKSNFLAESTSTCRNESCLDAVIKYANMGNRRPHVVFDCRKHLLHSNWKIERLRGNKFRYTSPDGKPFYSLRKVCAVLSEPHIGIFSSGNQEEDRSLFSCPGNSLSRLINHLPENRDSVVASHSDIHAHIVEPEYCPEAAVNWYRFGFKERLKSKKKPEYVKQMSLKAKKHLSALGWTFRYVYRKGRRELRYISQSGRSFNSLRAACRYSGNGIPSEDVASTSTHPQRKTNRKMTGGGHSDLRTMESPKLEDCSIQYSCFSKFRRPSKFQKLKAERIRKIKEKRKNVVASGFLQQEATSVSQKFPFKVRNRRKTRDLSGIQNDKKDTLSNCVLLSRKRVQQAAVSNPSHQKPRTVLSWLVNKTGPPGVLSRAKVAYCSSKGMRPIAEGRISGGGTGIKCNCCGKVYTLAGFDYHVAGEDSRPAGCILSNIFLEDGRSLLDCQMQVIHNDMRNFSEPSQRLQVGRHQDENDQICSVCHYGGELILCDKCPSSFHKSCLGMMDVPEGDWFCPSCCCKICGRNELNKETEYSTEDDDILDCIQCEHKYHTGCLRSKREESLKYVSKENWFCSKKCEEIFLGLHELLEKPIPVGLNNLTWTLLKSIQFDDHKRDASDIEALYGNYSLLNIALDVMHECFGPIEEPHTKRDLVKDVIFSRRSELNRLNFRGFYTVLLQKDDEVITVATVRIHGEKVAEIPLVATRFQYRRLGMCHMLMDVLEKKLRELGVQRLILPAVRSVLNTWTSSFGFSMLPVSERLQLLDYTFLDFQETVMCQKLLMKADSSASREVQRGVDSDAGGNGDNVDGSSSVSEVLQADQIESEIAEHEKLEVPAINTAISSVVPTNQTVKVEQGTDLESEPHAAEISLETMVKDLSLKKQKGENGNASKTPNVESRYENCGELKCYRRRRVLACGS